MTEAVVITLPLGKIRGVKRQGIYDHSYYSFERIPFAKPPLGELRFKAPEPPEPWDDILDCTEANVKPIQKDLITGELIGQEDCLYLNVFAKKLKSKTPLPVMIWIYGGAFLSGHATRERQSPDYLMHHDVIMVSFNYRLCSLGFLSLNDPTLEVPGNAGLKDQVMAIKWVNKYISYFNGNPHNITVLGNSAGGASTHYMMCTEQTRGLFQRGITMAGCVLNVWANTPQMDYAYRLAKLNGYSGENIEKDILSFLRGVDAFALIKTYVLTEEDRRRGTIFAFGPTVEPYQTSHCVIPAASLEMFRSAWGNDIPQMIGGCSSEGLLMYRQVKQGKFCPPDIVLPPTVRAQHGEQELHKLNEKLLQLHFPSTTNPSKRMFNCLDYLSYLLFWHDIHRATRVRLHYGSAPTYLYRFDFDSPTFNLYRKLYCGKDDVRGVAHGDEVVYLFHSNMSWKLPLDSEEYQTIQRMTALWTSFAATGNPNCDAIKPIVWKPVEENNPFMALNIGSEVTFIDLPEKEKIEVWNSLYKKLY